MTGDAGRDATVRDQYEAHPYPHRDPADERRRLITGSPSHLAEIEHYLLAGRRCGAIRALVAGGGTGDGAIQLAQQLADRGQGEVVYLDVSAASMAVARARAEVRGLRNVSFRQGSLLDVEAMGLEPFDYIDCCGVLHHLEDPEAGLAALARMLKADGGMGLMLYGAFGRTGVYPLQRAIRRLAGDDDDAARIALARRLLDVLPDSNWFKRNPYLGDHLRGDDAGLYDLLLHSRDRAYTVPELVELLTAAGLRITSFIPPVRYDPTVYLADDGLRARARRLDPLSRAALAEELAGNLKTHLFYAVKAGNVTGGVAVPDRADAVPVLRETDGRTLARSFRGTARLKVDLDGVAVRFDLPAGAADLVALIDGRRNLQEIHAALRSRQPTLDWLAFKASFDRLHAVLQPLNMLLLRIDPQAHNIML